MDPLDPLNKKYLLFLVNAAKNQAPALLGSQQVSLAPKLAMTASTTALSYVSVIVQAATVGFALYKYLNDKRKHQTEQIPLNQISQVQKIDYLSKIKEVRQKFDIDPNEREKLKNQFKEWEKDLKNEREKIIQNLISVFQQQSSLSEQDRQKRQERLIQIEITLQQIDQIRYDFEIGLRSKEIELKNRDIYKILSNVRELLVLCIDQNSLQDQRTKEYLTQELKKIQDQFDNDIIYTGTQFNDEDRGKRSKLGQYVQQILDQTKKYFQSVNEKNNQYEQLNKNQLRQLQNQQQQIEQSDQNQSISTIEVKSESSINSQGDLNYQYNKLERIKNKIQEYNNQLKNLNEKLLYLIKKVEVQGEGGAAAQNIDRIQSKYQEILICKQKRQIQISNEMQLIINLYK